MSDTYDWMQFNNGEWLKGDIEDLQDDDFVFDSDELDELQIDWEDVFVLYSGRTNTVMLRDRTTLEGRLRVEGDTVTVITDEGERSFQRSEIRSIVPGRLTWRNLWSGKITFGLTLRRGNVDQDDVTASVRLQRRDATSRFTFQYDGAVSIVDDNEVANNHRAVARYAVYLTERLYVQPLGVEAFRDRFANIEYRLTPSAGFGYDLVETSDVDWSVFAGFGWQFTEFDEASAGESRREDTGAVILGTSLEWEATKKIDVRFDYNLTVPVPNTNTYNFRADLRVEIEVYNDLDLDVGFIWDRINEPEPDAGGFAPEPDDFRIFVGLGWDF